MTKPILTYFDFPGGRGEDARLAFFIAGVDFEDDRIKGPTWMERKPTTPYGGLPTLAVGDKVIGESNAILGLIGRRHGLLPSDDWEAARHVAVMNAVEAFRHTIGATFTMSDEDKAKKRGELSEGYIQVWAGQMCNQIEGPYVGGETLSVADLKLFVASKWLKAGVLDHIPSTVLDGHEKLEALIEAVGNHPKVKEWYAR